MSKCFKCKNSIKSAAIYGLHEHCFMEWFGSDISLQYEDPNTASTGLNPAFAIEKSTDCFFHGRYLKYSARLGSTLYLLKVQEDDFPELPVTEYLSNEIADLLGITISPYYLIDFNGRPTFVTRNFMQDYTGTLHHIYKFLPGVEENYNCEELIKVISAETGRLSDIARFVEICLFDALIGNIDRHGRNLGIIETSDTKMLAPMYDNPAFLGIQDDFLLDMQFNFSGAIATRANPNPALNDYLIEFERLGHTKIIKHFCDKAISQLEKIADLINNSEISDKRKLAFNRLFDLHSEDLINAGQN